MITAQLSKEEIIVTGNVDWLVQRGFGFEQGKDYILTIYEAVFLLEKKKISLSSRGKEVLVEDLKRKKNFSLTEYLVYKDLRSKGYIVGSGLKYGFVFRVYGKGILPSQDHALWLVEVYTDKEPHKIRDLLGKNRIAHSARKKMLYAVVDQEQDVTYVEHSWKRM